MSGPVKKVRDAPLVMIDWEDSHSPDRWQSLDVLQVEPLICTTVGWMVYDGEDSKALVATMSHQDESISDHVTGTMVIPTSAVRKMTRLLKGKRRR